MYRLSKLLLWAMWTIVTGLIGSIGLCNLTNAANILAIFPSEVRSHFNLGKIIIDELVTRSHKITVISPFSYKLMHENITTIQLDGIREHFVELGILTENYLTSEGRSLISGITNLMYRSTALADFTLSNSQVKGLLKSDEKFDLLIVDMLYMDSLLGLAYYWQIPTIVLSASGTNKWTNEMVGNPHSPAYNPSIFLGYTDKMSLRQRVINALGSAFEKLTYKFMYLPAQEAIYQRHFRELLPGSLPPLLDLIHNVSLVLLNSHPSLQYPRPYVPNMIQVGGLHIKNPINELPADIANFIDMAPEGVIYMSFGTAFRAADLSTDKIMAFVKVFTKLVGKKRIILKWEDVHLPDHPDNTVTGPWLPQQEILNHPNVCLFITNGGWLSVMEAVQTATPILGIPLSFEQEFNVAQVEYYGFGKKLDLNLLTETTITDAINEILENPIYTENIRRYSHLFQDNLVDPLNSSIYHIEYVLRTNGSRHLRSMVVDLPFWKQYLLDVDLIIIAGLQIILAVPSFIICILLRKSNNSSSSSSSKFRKFQVNGNANSKKSKRKVQ